MKKKCAFFDCLSLSCKYLSINQISVLRITLSLPLSGLKNSCEYYAMRSYMQCSELDVNINEAHFSPATHSGFPAPLMHFLKEGVGGFIPLVEEVWCTDVS